MSESTLQAQIEAARAYEGLFVPALFGQWAPKVADAAQIRPHHQVLDVACGTGVLAREVRSRLDSIGAVTGLDPNPGMLAVASELAPAVRWQQGVAESLPFTDQSFDAVVSQFGLMFFADRQAALREMLRVLRPEGRLVVVVWDDLASMPAFAAEVELLERLAGAAAADALRAPFVLGDCARVIRLFQDAGVRGATVVTVKGIAQFPSVRTMVEADLRGWLPVMGVELTADQIGRILEEAGSVLAAWVTPDGRARFDLQAHLVAATKS